MSDVSVCIVVREESLAIIVECIDIGERSVRIIDVGIVGESSRHLVWHSVAGSIQCDAVERGVEFDGGVVSVLHILCSHHQWSIHQ